jgi:3-oxoacyl-[acyl-carrier-protein] synthase II
METYIQGVGMISPQMTFQQEGFLENPVEYNQNFLNVIDPGYKNYIDPKLMRRMSKVIKMGVAAAKISIDDAGIAMPGSIIAGTGLGCMEDTENFLSDLVKNNEQLLTPTAFIQSTHNTVAAQIALMLKCHETNFTYVHRGISFELALQDAMMQLKEKTADNILAGGVDELTSGTFDILQRLGAIKKKKVSNFSIYADTDDGTVYGEGAGFFVLGSDKTAGSYAKLLHVGTMLQPENNEAVAEFISGAVEMSGLQMSDISLVVGGMNGNYPGDEVYRFLQSNALAMKPWIGFKHLCGEYHTASAFALWLSCRILKEQKIPVLEMNNNVKGEIKNILIYNHYFNGNHAVYLLQAC